MRQFRGKRGQDRCEDETTVTTGNKDHALASVHLEAVRSEHSYLFTRMNSLEQAAANTML